MEYTVDGNTLVIDDIMNTSKGTDYATPHVAANLLDNLLAQNPEIQNIKWDAVTPEGMKFKEAYLKEHPELANKTSGISKYEELDSEGQEAYNENLRWLNDNRSKKQTGSGTEVRRNNQTSVGSEDAGIIQPTPSNNVLEKSLASSDSGSLSGREITSDSFNPQIKSADDITNGLTSGDIKLTSTKDADILVTKYQELDPEISGYTFKDVANDADGYYNRLMADGNTESAQAFANSLNTGDANLINQIVRKQIATDSESSKFIMNLYIILCKSYIST